MQPSMKCRAGFERQVSSIGLGCLCCYLMFSPVWFPDVAPRMYDNSRLLEIAMLVILVPRTRRRLARCKSG